MGVLKERKKRKAKGDGRVGVKERHKEKSK